MRISTRATLLSLFMFPGCGHIVLKKYISGGIFIGIAAIASLFIFANIMQRANNIANQIVAGHMPFDPMKIIELVTATPPADEAQLLNIVINVFLVTWIVSTIDAFRLGKKQEKLEP
jgi:uncharacterized membrane protein (DUF485 family)